MRFLPFLFSLAIAAMFCGRPVVAQVSGVDADPAFRKLLELNAGLKSYTAHIDVRTHLLFGSFSLHGTLYDRAGESVVVFDHVPSMAKSFVDDVPTIAGPADWAERYVISVGARTPDATTFHLVPRAAGSMRGIDVVVANGSGLVREYVWTKTGGMTITSDQQYESLDGYELVASTVTTLHGSGMDTTSTTTFSNYALNVALPEGLTFS